MTRIISAIVTASAIIIMAALMLGVNARFSTVDASDLSRPTPRATAYCSRYAPASWRNPGCGYSYETARTPQATRQYAPARRATPTPRPRR